jgi:hypothetical protein
MFAGYPLSLIYVQESFVSDPFLPKRNVARSMASKASLEYCKKCFRNTYKYFGILRTESGPIFDISLDVPDTSLLYAERVTAEKIERIIQNATNNHQNVTKDCAAILTVSQVEEELKRTSLGASQKGAKLISVSPQKAQEMYSCSNITSLHYEFHGENFIGNQVLLTLLVVWSLCETFIPH